MLVAAVLGFCAILAGCGGDSDSYRPTPIDFQNPTRWQVADPGPSPEVPASVDLTDGASVEEAVVYALAKNPELKALREEIRIAEARWITADTYPYNPEVGARAGDSDEYSRTPWELELSQTFELGGKRDFRRAAAHANIARARLGVEDRERLLRAQVQEGFYDLVRLSEEQALAREVEELGARLLAIAQSRRRAGQVSDLDVNLARGEHGLAQAEQIEIRGERETAVIRFNRLLGREGDESLETAGSLEVAPVSATLEGLLTEATTARPDSRALEAAERMSESEAQLARAQRTPDFRGSVFAREESDGERVFGIGISVPIPALNRGTGYTLEAQARTHQIRAERRALELLVTSEIRSAWASMQRTGEIVRLYRESILPDLEQNILLLQTAYERGELGITDVIPGQERYVRARKSALRAAWEHRQSRVDLERAAGRGIE